MPRSDSVPDNSRSFCCERKRVIGPMARTKASDVTGPIPGWVIKQHRIFAALGFFQNRAIQLRDSGLELVEQFQKFFAPPAGPRPQRQGCSNSTRPFLVNSFFLRHSPWLMASACSWLPSIVRMHTSL